MNGLVDPKQELVLMALSENEGDVEAPTSLESDGHGCCFAMLVWLWAWASNVDSKPPLRHGCLSRTSSIKAEQNF